MGLPDSSLGALLGWDHVDRAFVFFQSDQCLLLEKPGWSYQEYCDSKAHAGRPQLVSARSDCDRTCGGVIVWPYVSQRRNRSGGLGNRWVARDHHDGQRPWDYLAEPEENYRRSDCCSTGHPCTAGDGSMGTDSITGFSCEFPAFDSHVVFHGSG